MNVIDAAAENHLEYNMDIENTVKKTISEQLRIDLNRVTMSSTFEQDLGADSLDVVEIAMILEEKFNLEIPDDEAVDIDTVGDVVNLLTKLTA